MPQQRSLAMNKSAPAPLINMMALTKKRRRIDVHEFAEKLCCHPDTVK
jgi:hypothetical protein